MTNCPVCGHEIPGEAKYCAECGSKAIDQTCDTCGGSLESNAKFCPECGSQIVSGRDALQSKSQVFASNPAVALPQPNRLQPSADRHNWKPLIAIGVLGLLLILAASGIVAYKAKAVYDEGQQRQSELQATYDADFESMATCIQERAAQSRVDNIHATNGLGDDLLQALVVLSLAEFVDSDGEVIPVQDADTVRPYVVSLLSDYTNFDQTQAETVVEIFAECRGPSSPIREVALSFRSWLGSGDGPSGWLRKGAKNDLSLRAYCGANPPDAYDDPFCVGRAALAQMAAVVCPHDFSEAPFYLSDVSGFDCWA